ncbi:DUF1761 domain-containing protein [Maricaulis maris]|uniref:Uncharacterized protein DUF1761 n=1 Tax=Maricaulis maris TaxID=74318 RepID=A0A495DKW0_9PROT|nr:DUF1761 domain-containing protein [Maricaulis maris]RKR03235.1 uncharacterized protein DUF1761 [Maricaulis maris]
MPRIFGLNIIATLVAGIAFWMVGALFYGVLFAELWLGLWGFTAADEPRMEAAAGLSMGLGFLLSIVFAGVLGFTLKALKADGMVSAIKWAIFLWAGFVITTMSYDILYALQPVMLLVLDGAHTLTGFVVMAVLLTVLDKTAVKD